VGEALPTAHGLNLFISVNPERQQTPKPDPPTMVNATSVSKSAVPTPQTPTPLNAPSASTKIRSGISVEDPEANRQAPKPNGAEPNGTG
jgi:hypothetical protein